MDYRQRFISVFSAEIRRPGAPDFIRWLQTTDFFEAPASTRYHLACPQGLVAHSLNVYDILMERHFEEGSDDRESFALCALLHDVCKAQFYRVSERNVKNEETGRWEKVPYYTIADGFPYGHGEKSVFLIERFIRLKPAEAVAIRWHMGGFDDAARGGGFTISQAYNSYPLAVKLHLADLEATYLREPDRPKPGGAP